MDSDLSFSDDDIAQASQRYQRQSQSNAVGAANDNPDHAAQALDLSQATGAPAPVIYNDLPNFKSSAKAQAAGALVAGNPQLQALTQDPMRARVTNDDLANLDRLSGPLNEYAKPSIWDRLRSAGRGIADAFDQGFDLEGFRQEYHDLVHYSDNPLWQGFVRNTAGINPAILGDAAMRLMSGATSAATTGLADIYSGLGGQAMYEKFSGGRSGAPEKLASDLTTAAQVAFAPEMHLPPELNAAAEQARAFNGAPPAGINPIIDVGHAAQNAKDLAALKDALAQAQTSLTRERSPAVFKQYVEQHTGASIGISHDAVRELYGNEPPSADDGKLGFVEDLPAQILRSMVTGTDIQIPVSDWLTHVDPAVATQLEPYIRTRPDSVTEFEAQGLAARYEEPRMITAYHGSNGPDFGDLDPAIGGKYSEGGSLFFSPDPETAGIYTKTGPTGDTGQRIYKVKIDPSNAKIYDVKDMFFGDKSEEYLSGMRRVVRQEFYDRADPATRDTERGRRDVEQTVDFYHNRSIENIRDLYDEQKRYDDMLKTVEARKYLDPRDTHPPTFRFGALTGVTGMIRDLARAQGKDVAIIRGLGDLGDEIGKRPRDQIMVLNKDRIKPFWTRTDEAAQGLAALSGLSPRVPRADFTQVATPKDGTVHYLRRDDTGDHIFLERNSSGDQYAKVGTPETVGDALQRLRSAAGEQSPLGDALHTAISTAADHVGFSARPVYTVRAGHPALEIKNNANTAAGMYYPSHDAVLLREGQAPQRMLEVMQHEVAHGVFYRAIESDPALKGAIESVMGEARAAEQPSDDMRFAYDGGQTAYYGLTNPHEFISEVFGNAALRDHLAATPLSEEGFASLKQYLGDTPRSRLGSLWDAVLMLARKAFGMPLTDDSLSLLDAAFKLIDRGTGVARADIDGPADALPAMDPVGDHAKAIGMNAAQTQRYRELIEKQRGEEADARNSKILAEERKRQGAEWKRNEVEERKAASNDLKQRPDIVADAHLRGGAMLDTDALTPEQRTAMEGAHTRGGVNPDDLAAQVGYDTGDQMIRDVSALRASRGDAQPLAHFRSMVEDETQRRMEAKYGNLDENVVEAAKDRVLSQTQTDMLHLDAEAQGLPVSKAQLQANVRDLVGQMPLGQINSTAAMAAAGRAAQALENALLKGDAGEAFAQRMRQYNHLLAAKEMLRIEKAKAQFGKLAKRYSATSVNGASQEYVEHIRDLLSRLGQPVKGQLAPVDLARFVAEKTGDFRELYVPDFLQDGEFRTPVDQLPAAQFEATHNALKAMAFNARDEMKIIRAGEKADLRSTIDEMVAQLGDIGTFRKYPASQEKFSLRNTMGSLAWSHVIMESVFNRFDRGDWGGLFNQTIVRNYTEAANYRERLMKDFADKLSAVGRVPDYEKRVENNFLRDPTNGYMIDMKRKNVLAMVQNAGNAENLQKLAAGYKIEPGALMQWLFDNTTKEDWDRAQHIGGLFDELHELADTMSRNISGVGVDKIDLQPLQTPFGEYSGWYHPLNYSDIREGKSKALLGGDMLEREGYYRATTPKAYTKTRTGYVAPVELDMNIVPVRMQQMIHDIAMRPAVIQLSKFFQDSAFRDAIRDYYGIHQRDMLLPFLRDMANASNYRSEAASIGNAVLSKVASNTISTLVGLNPRTVAKHSSTAFFKSALQAGPVGFARESLNLFRDNGGQSNWKMAMEKSDELRRRLTNWDELMAQRGQSISLSNSGARSRLTDARAVMQHIGSMPLATTDLLSAVPHWLAVYKEAIAKGEDEGMAVSRADRDVRQTHGSSIFTNRPEIARSSSPIAKSYASLYGFFSENLQKQFEAAWRVRDALGMNGRTSQETAMANLPKIASLVLTSTILPAVIEEAVSPSSNDPHESWGHYAATIALHGLTSGFIGVRDIASSLISGRDPSGGMFQTTAKGFVDSFRDVGDAGRAVAEGKTVPAAKAAKSIRDAFITFGYGTGLTNATEGRIAQYLYRYFHGLEHPKGPWDVTKGMAKGKS